MRININTSNIDSNPILAGILSRTTKKYMSIAEHNTVFLDMAAYIYTQCVWKKQSAYEYALPLLLEACRSVSEDFWQGCENYAPDAKTYQDLHFSIFNAG